MWELLQMVNYLLINMTQSLICCGFICGLQERRYYVNLFVDEKGQRFFFNLFVNDCRYF